MLKDMFETLMVKVADFRRTSNDAVDYEDLGLSPQSQSRNFEQTVVKLQEEIKKMTKMQQESSKEVVKTGVELEHALVQVREQEIQMQVEAVFM